MVSSDVPAVSVIIPAFNAESTIGRCIHSLTLQSCPREKFEIIVIDDNSTDRTVELAKDTGADVVICLNQNSGQGNARNVGIKQAKGNILAFIDSDCEAKSDWIETIVKELQTNLAIGGSILNGNSYSLIAWADFLLEFIWFDEHNERSFVNVFAGCNGACKKEVFDKVGGFQNVRSGEDTLFSYAIIRNGLKILFIPELQVSHLSRTALNKFLRIQRKLGKNRVVTTRLDPTIPHRLITKGRVVIPLIFIGKIFKIGYYYIRNKKASKFFCSFPYIILGTSSFCKGMWNEMKNV